VSTLHVAKKYGLYCKITGAQRIDMFGAKKPDLLNVWTELVDAGMESGHAYAVFLGDGPDRNEFIGRDFTTGDSGYHREGAISLDVGEELVIYFLQKEPRVPWLRTVQARNRIHSV
jgi:hypothetical protein